MADSFQFRRVLRSVPAYALLACVVGLLSVFLLYPIYLTVRGGFASDVSQGTGFTLDHIAMVFRDPAARLGLFNSFKIAAGTTGLAMLIGVPLAVLSAQFRFPGKRFFNAMALVPLILPPFVGAIGVRAILGREGALNALLGTDLDILGSAKYWGVIAVQSLSLYPIIFLNATAAIANLDPALDEAARSVGASWRRRFFSITVPLIRPGIFAGGTIVFIWSFTELGTPLMFDYSMVAPVQIFYGLKEVETSAQPYALTVVLLAMAVTMYAIGKLVFGRRGYAMYAKASRAGDEATLTGWHGWAATSAFALVAVMALLPHLGVVLTSLTSPGQWYSSVLPTRFTIEHYRQALTTGDSFGAIVNSLKLAACAMLLDIVVGIVVAYIVVRTTVRGRWLVDALCMLPLAVPGLVMAFGFVAMSLRWPFGRDGPLSGIASIFGTTPAPFLFLVVAYSVRRLPYIVRSTIAGLEQTSGELEEAAMVHGATRFTAVRKIVLPLIAANLIAGGLLVFSFSMLEVSDSLLLAQQAKDYPITKAIFSFTERLGDGLYIASALGVWAMALLTVTLFGASLLLGKKLGAIFRV
ncbi:MAG: iron ABC transporter permease [Phycisphaeraceae bacterium]|nr:iron ABC transporter permease [Phycisphaerae bacterium]MBX3393693.1 iron ABC transporter permease [Phycisphaeraceae bacterium]